MRCWLGLVNVNMRTGYLQVICSKKEEKTIVKDAYFEGALKITRPVYLNESGEAYLYLMNPGGGYLDGDSYKMEISLEEDAHVVLTTQASNKIYKTIAKPALQEAEFFLKKGSCFEYLPDPIIAFQYARFVQKTVVKMEQGASFICKDIFTPGWSPNGDLFQYDSIQSRMDIYINDHLILFDHLKLETDEDLQGISGMEGYSHYGVYTVIDERVNRQLLDELYQLLSTFSNAKIGMSLLSVPGLSLRVLANSTQEIDHIIHCCHKHIRSLLLKIKPISLRKY